MAIEEPRRRNGLLTVGYVPNGAPVPPQLILVVVLY